MALAALINPFSRRKEERGVADAHAPKGKQAGRLYHGNMARGDANGDCGRF